MHTFHFTREALVNDASGFAYKRTLHVSVSHNSDWSGDAMISIVATPSDLDEHAAERWYNTMPERERAKHRTEATVDAQALLRGDIDPGDLPPLVARVLGPAIAQAVCRHLHLKAITAAEGVWLP